MPYVISGTIEYVRMAGAKHSEEEARAFYWPLARGEPLTPELLALKPDPYIVVPPKVGDMPEIFGEALGVWTVKENVKEIIESLEPGIHTFLPVNLKVQGSEKDCGRYYLLYPGQVIDAVVIDDTRFAEGFGRAGFEKSHTPDSLIGPTVLRRALIEGRHLWRGGIGRLGGGGDPFSRVLFSSDELAKSCIETGIEGWRFRRCEVKQVGWVK